MDRTKSLNLCNSNVHTWIYVYPGFSRVLLVHSQQRCKLNRIFNLDTSWNFRGGNASFFEKLSEPVYRTFSMVCDCFLVYYGSVFHPNSLNSLIQGYKKLSFLNERITP